MQENFKNFILMLSGSTNNSFFFFFEQRQRLVTDKMPLHVLIERYLPMEYRKLLIPVAVSGNKVIPSKSMWSSGKW